MSGEPKDVCLQCGECRAAVAEHGYSCATLTGYETVEADQTWERHHWRDWSDQELASVGISPHRWGENRRTLWQELEFEIARSICDRQGHVYPEGADDPKAFDYGMPKNLCLRCFTRQEV